MPSLKLLIKRRLLYFYRRFLAKTQVLTRSGFFGETIHNLELPELVESNRTNLKLIDEWIPAGLLENSVFQYGILPEHRQLLNLPVDSETTHADLLCYFACNLKETPKYLELGLSVGKTFWQVMLSRPDIECWGFDIEEMNPVLQEHLLLESREEWPALDGSPKTTPSSISRFLHRTTGQKVVYICADIFDPRAWKLLENGMFNLVLSDALHTPQAIDFEWKHMVSGRVFNPREIVVMWDDLDGAMREWFENQIPSIASALGTSTDHVGSLFVNGWLGRREFPHRIGLAAKLAEASPKR